MSVGQRIMSLHFRKQLSEKNIVEMKEIWDELESFWNTYLTWEDVCNSSIWLAVEQGN